ncbi:hypothetical protein Pan14r_18070 [Crateriforma conspicua]|uniref:Uncharacterized protein n=2 Tax=Crateriforma conspicua TaxID=2527996 RepID=A0A5C5Y3Y5_9PLAN|nr:hypothetical protein Pan14r_18070 [Crateriforma conspicua]
MVSATRLMIAFWGTLALVGIASADDSDIRSLQEQMTRIVGHWPKGSINCEVQADNTRYSVQAVWAGRVSAREIVPLGPSGKPMKDERLIVSSDGVRYCFFRPERLNAVIKFLPSKSPLPMRMRVLPRENWIEILDAIPFSQWLDKQSRSGVIASASKSAEGWELMLGDPSDNEKLPLQAWFNSDGTPRQVGHIESENHQERNRLDLSVKWRKGNGDDRVPVRFSRKHHLANGAESNDLIIEVKDFSEEIQVLSEYLSVPPRGLPFGTQIRAFPRAVGKVTVSYIGGDEGREQYLLTNNARSVGRQSRLVGE